MSTDGIGLLVGGGEGVFVFDDGDETGRSDCGDVSSSLIKLFGWINEIDLIWRVVVDAVKFESTAGVLGLDSSSVCVDVWVCDHNFFCWLLSLFKLTLNDVADILANESDE